MALRLSIITCTWNSAAFLQQSIHSVLEQDHADIEYIFVDGGSTDQTLQMIRAVPREVKLIENVGGGIARAMNAGIEAATGDVVAHLHSDDYYAHCQALSHVSEALENSDAGWLFGRCLSDIDGQRIPENHAIPRFRYRRVLKGNFIPHPATFVRRSLLARVGGFDTTLKYAMDYDMWLRLGRIAAPVQLDEHLAVFRRHSGSLTSSNRMASLQDDFSVRMRYVAKNPWSMLYHWAHFAVRRQRLAQTLRLHKSP